jgi:hypothetical protein
MITRLERRSNGPASKKPASWAAWSWRRREQAGFGAQPYRSEKAGAQVQAVGREQQRHEQPYAAKHCDRFQCFNVCIVAQRAGKDSYDHGHCGVQSPASGDEARRRQPSSVCAALVCIGSQPHPKVMRARQNGCP